MLFTYFIGYGRLGSSKLKDFVSLSLGNYLMRGKYYAKDVDWKQIAEIYEKQNIAIRCCE